MSLSRWRVLLPSSRWGRVALLLLVLFALLRSVVWASAQPGWFAPDEDYHWLYVEHLLIEKEIPDLDQPFATQDLFTAVVTIQQGQYGTGPRRDYPGTPHATVKRMKLLPSNREPTGERPREVLHPPLYHLGAVLVDRAVTDRAAVTRLTAMRYWSALLGALGVWAAWLLAAQVLPRVWQQFAAAALVATQPIVAFSASTMTNDVLALLALTLVLAWCANALRAPPRARDGLLLGALLAIAVLSKATLLATIPLAVLTLLMSWRAFRLPWRLLARLAGLATLVLAAGTAWWLRIIIPETHSVLGARVSITSGPAESAGGGTPKLGLFDAAYKWLSSAYKGYWFDYLSYEVTTRDLWYYLPLVLGSIGITALLATIVSHRRDLFRPAAPELRQIVLLVAAVMVLLLPPLWFDTRAAGAGHAFTVVQGRFLAPAYPAAAVLFVLATSHVLRRFRAAAPVVIGTLVAVSFVNYGHTWVRWCLERFYGGVRGDWIDAFRRASWDKPEWVGAGWFATLAIAAIVAFVAAYVLVVIGSRREGDGRESVDPPATPVVRGEQRPRTVAVM
jgi:4-amino-4-deoxy-L-arabinose transferase-like glycosyltransferase